MGASYDFERADGDKLTRASLLDFKNTSFTATAWVKPESAPGYSGIVGNDDFGPMVVATHSTKFASLFQGWLDGITFSYGIWYFIATTFDGGSGSGNLRIYSGTNPSNLQQDNTAVRNEGQGNTNVNVAWYRTGDVASYDGLLSHVMVFDRALSLSELKEIMVKPGSIVKNLIFHLPLVYSDAGKDISGNGIDFTVSGTPEISTDAPPVFFPKL